VWTAGALRHNRKQNTKIQGGEIHTLRVLHPRLGLKLCLRGPRFDGDPKGVEACTRWEPNPGEFQKIAMASFPSDRGHGDLAVAPARVSDVRGLWWGETVGQALPCVRT
jgi:hypothetical protein